MIQNIKIYLEKYFPLAILVTVVIAFSKPDLFLWIKPYIPFLLGMVMMSIGITIDTKSLKENFLQSKIIIFIAIAKFVFLPILGLGLGGLFNLSPELIIGLVIVGSCPGGASANFMSYLARSNVALAVILTIITTLLCPIIMPAMIYLLLHKVVIIPVWEIVNKLFWIVAFPILDGLIIRRFFLKQVEKITWACSPISIVIIIMIIGCVSALNRQTLMKDPWLIAGVVLLVNCIGYLVGYFLGKFLKCDQKSSQATAFEFGIQDSSIGIMLATTFFSPLSALPSALFSIIQNMTAPVLVSFFKRDKL